MTSAGGQSRPEDDRSTNSPVALLAARDPTPQFAEIVNEHLDFVWRLLRRLGLSPTDADDAAQQVFILAEGKREQITPGKERSFLYGTALRVCANVQRLLHRRREVSDSGLVSAASGRPLPDRLLELDRARSLLDELLSELPDELARVLLLAEMEGYTLAAIAELEGIPPGTAASRLRRARALFRDLLAREAHRNPFGAAGQ
jgi:RNA polymerase sigma-70 factor (ECF subfamily)